MWRRFWTLNSLDSTKHLKQEWISTFVLNECVNVVMSTVYIWGNFVFLCVCLDLFLEQKLKMYAAMQIFYIYTPVFLYMNNVCGSCCYCLT